MLATAFGLLITTIPSIILINTFLNLYGIENTPTSKAKQTNSPTGAKLKPFKAQLAYFEQKDAPTTTELISLMSIRDIHKEVSKFTFSIRFNKLQKKWEDECDCEHFIPHFSEGEGDYELEAVSTFNTSFECPFCGNTVHLQD